MPEEDDCVIDCWTKWGEEDEAIMLVVIEDRILEGDKICVLE